MNYLKVSVVTPNGMVVDGEYEMVSAKTEAGEIGVLPGHIPLVTPLAIGAVRLKKDNQTEWVAVSGGFMEVGKEGVTILAQSAETAASIDLARAEQAKKRAETLLSASQENVDYVRADLALKRAINRINTGSQNI